MAADAAAARALVTQRLTAQLLAGPPATDPVAVAERLLAIQAQDLRGAQLAVRARTKNLTVTDLDRALTTDRSLLITTLNRGTLHLVRREDYPWLQALTTPPSVAGNAKRLSQEGVTPAAAERGVRVITKALTDDGPLIRDQLRRRVEQADVPTAGQAFAHLIMLSALRGLTIRGPMIGREQGFVLVSDWIGTRPKVDRDRALAELARRFLSGHAPATDRDLARWAGLPLRDARAGLNALKPGQREPASVRAARLPPPRLLGAYEPLLMGWTSREPILGPNHRAVVIAVNGLFRPFVLVNGRAVGTWRYVKNRAAIELFDDEEEDIPPTTAKALNTDADDVVRYLSGSTAPSRSARTRPPARD